ncbi:hypothetical protein P5837_30615, partial [Bacillus cereus]|nr:hypothetical protein [Bacillus cereus]
PREDHRFDSLDSGALEGCLGLFTSDGPGVLVGDMMTFASPKSSLKTRPVSSSTLRPMTTTSVSPQSANALSINSDIASPLISVIVSFVGLVIDHVMNHGAQLRVGVAVLVYVILIFLVTLLVRLNEVNLVDHLCGRLGEILEQASADSSYHAGTEHHSVPDLS